jgi:hypothetical protein
LFQGVTTIPLSFHCWSGYPLQVLAKFRYRYTLLWAFHYYPSRARN